jgi:arginyl-tRNA synthetase
MLQQVKEEIAKALAKAAEADEELALSSIEIAKPGFGDLSSKLAFMLAKERKTNPALLAKEISEKLAGKAGAHVGKVEAAGPYVNFHLSDGFYAEALKEIVGAKEFGRAKKTGKKMMVEFFHANTHKGVHIGHIRNISLGETLSRILEFGGNKVIRANYQGDIGPHVAKCLWGFINLYHEKAPEENRGVWLGKVYSEASKKIAGNEELEKQVQDLNLKIYAKDKHISGIWKKTRQWCLDDFEIFYKEYGVKFDELYFESQTEGVGKEIALGLLKKGIAKQDQGAVIMDFRDEDLGVFVLLTKEGYPLYSAKDLGLAKLKFDKYELDRSIHVVAKEQEFYFRQLFRAFKKAGMEKAAKISHHLVYELVMLPEGKMSSREGTMVLYDELKGKLLELVRVEVRKRHEDWNDKTVEETAKKITFAAIKFSMVRRESNRTIVFDWDQALSLEGDSGPYLQYAYVRTRGIFGKAESGDVPKVATGYKFDGNERTLIKKLAEFPEVAQKCARDLQVHQLPNYTLDVATEFNKFYATSSVLGAETAEARGTRLAIVEATGMILKSSLGLMGIECPEKM